MTLTSPAKRILLVALVACVLGGCGAGSPQAPLRQARKLGTSTGGISTACGLAYQVTAFAGNHQPELERLEATAAASAQKLASVYARNQAWIYQGETVHDIVRDSLSMLGACGLTRAESVLAHATYARRGHA